MKKIIIIALIASTWFITGCGGKENTSEQEATTQKSKNKALDGMIMISLLDYGMPIWVTVPDTLMAPLDITVQDWGEIEVRSGKNFQISIAEGGDLELKKSDIQSDLLYTDLNISIDEPNGLVYSQGIEGDDYFKPLFHFYAVKTINGIDYEFKDVEGEYKYPEKVVLKMFEAVKITELDDRKPS